MSKVLNSGILQQTRRKILKNDILVSVSNGSPGIILCPRIASIFNDGSYNRSFNIGTGFQGTVATQQVNTIVQHSDGKIICGGAFATYNGVSANSIVRLNADGSRDTSFAIGTGFNNTVNRLAIQSDGKVIVGGLFTTYQGVAANRIIRLNADGSSDTSFAIGTGFNNTVNHIAIQSDGKVIVGGAFVSYQGVSANRIIRLNADGSRDTSFAIGTGFFNVVNHIAIQSDGKVIVGGAFTTYQGVAANYIIRLNTDGSRDTSFAIGTGFGNTVNRLAIQSDGKVICGGGSSTYQGVSTGSTIIRLNTDGSRDTSFAVGGSFNYSNDIILQNDGKIIIFLTFWLSQNINGIARLNVDGTIDTSFTLPGLGFPLTVRTLAILQNNTFLVGGAFNSYGGETGSWFTKINKDGRKNTVFNIPLSGTLSPVTARDIAVQSDGKIIVGGAMSYVNEGVTYNRIVRFNTNGSRDTSFVIGTGFNNNVNRIAIQSNGKIIVGGAFTTYQGASASAIIRLNADGSRDTSFVMGTGFGGGTVFDAVIQSDGKVICVGTFTAYQGVAANRIIRLNADGSRDTSFVIGTGLNNTVNRLAIQSDGKIICGGDFTTYQGVAANRIIRLNADGSRDTSFASGTSTNTAIVTVAIQSDGKIICGGSFTTYQGVSANSIVRLNADGSRDTSFVTPTSLIAARAINALTSPFTLQCMLIQSDGKIIIGGNTIGLNGELTSSIMVLNPNGSINRSFKYKAVDYIRTIALL
jgi:uncharacterized delta-60 repeat protein